jgi:hypothetical protein
MRKIFLDKSFFRCHMSVNLLIDGHIQDAIRKVEQVRFPRTVSQTVPGRLRASHTPALRPVREVQSLDWDR